MSFYVLILRLSLIHIFLEGGQTAAGSILTWFKNNLLPAAWMQEAVNRNMNIYDLITEKASEVPIGCDGLVTVSYTHLYYLYRKE